MAGDARTGAEVNETPKLRVLSLGAGVQSTTLALMAAHGEIGPMPDCAIFADTGWEPQRVYRHLDWLETQLPFPVYRVARANLRNECLRNTRGEITYGRCSTIPAFARGKDGRAAPLTRQCTRDYKIEPIIRKVRDLANVPPRSRPKGMLVEQWIGISTDEAHRMKPAREGWISTRWPLIEKRLSRSDCLRWIERQGYPAPGKSSCIGCPYHSDIAWRDMCDNDPESWSDAVAFDRAIRAGFKGSRGEVYLHRSLTPLDQVDLSTAAERGQPDLFGNECEGMCGV